ncbi:MAG: transposase [Betaproteobacteria bacterium]|nr:transposase [Betaproteobacteria bacterium]
MFDPVAIEHQAPPHLNQNDGWEDGSDRAGVERLPRYCARAALAREHLATTSTRASGLPQLLAGIDGPSALGLTPLALINRIAAPLPPPRIHRHRY